MKTTIFSRMLFAFLSLQILSSCESPEPKSDEAFENVKQEKLLSKDSISKKNATPEEPTGAESAKKNARQKGVVNQSNQDEWSIFKMETEKIIRSNENKIKEIKSIPDARAKLLRQVSRLEKDNNDLKKQMDEYIQDEKARWENFKTSINKDVTEIDSELKDMKANAKK